MHDARKHDTAHLKKTMISNLGLTSHIQAPPLRWYLELKTSIKRSQLTASACAECTGVRGGPFPRLTYNFLIFLNNNEEQGTALNIVSSFPDLQRLAKSLPVSAL